MLIEPLRIPSSRRTCARVCHKIRPAALIIILLVVTCPAVSQRVWVQHGPGPHTGGQVEGITDGEVVGAVHTVATHPTDVNTIYVGTTNGGIWKTTNATAARPTWVEQLGLNRSLSIGAIQFDPTDATNQTLIAGSGRFSNFSLDPDLDTPGGDRVGVWRTTDGGTNWTLLNPGGTLNGSNITGVAPRGAVLVVSIDNRAPFANRGLWRSINTGGAWTQISGGAGTGLPVGASFDLASDPSNNARLFTNAGTNGIYRSIDTGANWTKVSDAAIDALLTGATSTVEIVVGTSNNVFVCIVNNDRLAGLFRSGDGGNNWTALDIPTTTEGGTVYGIHPGGQGDTNTSMAADRTNANVVYIAGDRQPSATEAAGTPTFPNSVGANDYTGRVYRVDASQPAGSQAAHITHTNTSGGSSPHADSRDMAIDANNDLIETDDGGIYRRTTPLLNTGDWFSVIGTLGNTELHDTAWDSNAKIIIGGAQDVGTPQQVLPANVRWFSVRTGDGGDVAVDDFGTPGTSIRYSSDQDLGGFRRRTYGSANNFVSQAFPTLTVVSGAALTAQFTTPIAINNVTPTRLIIGGNNSVYESLDQGDTISEIGAGIRVNARGREPIAYGAAGNDNMLYVGSNDQVFVRAAAAPAALTASAAYPGAGTGRPVAGIAIDPADPQTAFVVDTTNVYRTDDAGATWDDITGDLATLSPGRLTSIAYSTSNADGSVIVGSETGVFIGRGPTFTTWLALGTGFPRVLVYDLEYDAVDELVIAGTLGRGAWTLSLNERTPVDVSLVLDLSGSMLSPACATCDPKLQVLKDSVELFVQLWTVFTIPDDRMSVNYFRTNVSEFTVGPDVLVPVLPNAQAIITDVQAQTTVGTNLTAMGGGLQTAINRLTDPARPRNIILFTDGMQNVNPMVNNTTFEITDVAGRPASGVAATTPPTDLNAALAIKVNTIGVGATPAFVDLLDDIAGETNGLYKLTTAPDEDLRRFYVEELIDVLRQFSPQLLGYRYGTLTTQSANEAFTTNGSARRVVFKLSWKRGTRMDFTVEKDGVDVTRLGRVIEGPFYRIFSIDVPRTMNPAITSAGSWKMQIAGTKGTAYEAAGIVEEEELKYEFTVAGKGRVVGDPLPLSVKLTYGGQPVTDARVTARVLAPTQALGTLLSQNPSPTTPAGFQSEPAATDAQRKFQLLLGQDSFQKALRPSENPIVFQNNGNGTYSATFTNTFVSGPYTVIYKVEGLRSDIGAYERTESRSVALRFGTPSLAASDLRILSRRPSTAGRFDLSVRPVDSRGNFLGPDYGHAIAVSVNGVRVTNTPTDVLDGSYIFSIITTGSPSATNITVTVMGRPLYNGLLSGIPGSGSSMTKFAFSAHVGVAVPVTGFGPGASTRLLTEFDFEYRATPKFSLEGVVGYYNFSPGSITSGSLLFKGYLPVSSGRFFLAGGPGAFHPSGGTVNFGLNGGAGFNKPVNSWLDLEFGASYSHIFRSTSDLGFLGVKGGVKFKF
jgi:von Willebrand factor type A domain